ncbi:3-methyl-2-oxobutanoate hydroxymethyltransferase [Gammaproteobacteria bacterium]
MKTVTPAVLRQMKEAGEKIACLTAYDASFSALLEDAGVEVVLVGDSLGMVVQGQASTLPVTVDAMVYHTTCVARGIRHALLVADLPFLSYTTPDRALDNAGRLMAAGARMIKLEGGSGLVLETVRRLGQWGIPVCAHLGLLPQSVHKLGGYRVQGRDPDQAATILEDAQTLEEAGVELLVLECVPVPLARQITAALKIPVIGIGAGISCDGQVLVLYDMLGVVTGKRPRFSRDFMPGNGSIREAVATFVREVKVGTFPKPEHSYS